MKRFLIAVSIIALSTGLSYAQTQAPAAKQPAPPAPAVQTKAVPVAPSLSGKIQSVTEADVAKGTTASIVITGADNAAKTFVVKAGTTIYDAAGKPLTLKDLQKDQAVKVIFKASPDGILEALAIYQTK